MDGTEAHSAIRDLAFRQHGIVARSQLRRLGVGRGLLAHALKTWRLIPVFQGIYVLGRPVDGYRPLWMAATLAAGPSSVLAGSTAAAAWGFMKATSEVEVSRIQAHSLHLTGSACHHDKIRVTGRRSNLLPAERTFRGPIPVMSVAGTLIQLAGSLEETEMKRAFIEAGRQGLVGRQTLQRCADIGTGYKGAAALRSLMAQWHPGMTRTRSVLEGEFLLLCSRSGIEEPEVNVRVCGLEVDCLWRDRKVIVELDGRAFHDDSFAFQRDRERRNRLVGAGYKVLNFTWQDVTTMPSGTIRQTKFALSQGEVGSKPIGDRLDL